MSENTQRKKARRDNDVQITTREFALMLGVPEHELGVAAATTNIFREITLPAPVSLLKGKTRQFWLSECLAFAEQLKGTSAEKNNLRPSDHSGGLFLWSDSVTTHRDAIGRWYTDLPIETGTSIRS